MRHVRRAVIGAAAAYDDGVGRFGVEADIIVLRWVGRDARGGGSSDGLGWARVVEEWAERAADKAVQAFVDHGPGDGEAANADDVGGDLPLAMAVNRMCSYGDAADENKVCGTGIEKVFAQDRGLGQEDEGTDGVPLQGLAKVGVLVLSLEMQLEECTREMYSLPIHN